MLTSAHIRKVGSVSFCVAAVLLSLCLAAQAFAANIKVVSSAPKVSPGENFFIDIIVENIPSEGLGAVQFKLNVSAPGSVVAPVSETSLGKSNEVSVATPLLIGPATASRSGIGEFFWNATGPHGILVMDNETLKNGSGLYTFGHTNGAVPPQGSGSIVRFQFAVGKDVAAEKIDVALSDVVLLDTGVVYPLESNIGATIDLKCYTTVPDLLGLSQSDAQAALQQAKLSVGNIYEIDNQDGTHPLNKVLAQSQAKDARILCETPVDLAINTAPSEVGNAVASDKAGDETGTVTITYLSSSSTDAAGYRVYLVSSGVRLTEVGNPATTSVELTGLVNSQATQLRITAYDTHGNESQGVVISATAQDDVAPRVAVTGVADGAFYAFDVQPGVDVQDANLAATVITLNGAPYNLSPIILENDYTLKVVAADLSGNTTTKEVVFAVDKTAPVITVAGIEKGKYYNVDLSPTITVTDAHLLSFNSLLNGSHYSGGSTITAEASYELVITAQDKAGNSASDTYLFYIDKTPPVSSITAGDPKFVNNDVTFITGSTLLTLTGTDAGPVSSGIERLESRINTGEWGVYQAPFALSGLNDGEASVYHRAVDRAGNAEDFHTVTYTVDNTPPVSTITVGNPQYSSDGKLYIGGSTNIAIIAEDALSGVQKIEYSIDGGAFTAYAGSFTLGSLGDGAHTVTYRSVDNVQNTESARDLAVVLDKTPPVTAITASDPLSEGQINTVSPVTLFTLTATDNLSGVRATSYRIDDGTWQAYTGSFSLAGKSAGQHTIAYKSMDNVLNEETEKSITVRLIVMEVKKGMPSDSVVLVGVWSDNSDLAQKQADTKTLENLLSSIGVTYFIAPDMTEFTKALRSGRYNTYILIDVKEPLIGGEVREAVNFGDGLIFVKTSPQADPFHDDVFGVKFTGKTTDANLTVNIAESPISNEGTLDNTGKNVVATITAATAQSFATVTDKQNTYPVIVFNQYGRGRALLYAFDVLTVSDQARAAALIVNSINYVRPIEQYPRPLASVPVRITLTNSTEQIDVRVKEILPLGMLADTISPTSSQVENTITWDKSLQPLQKTTFGYYLNLPDLAGEYTTSTEVRYRNLGDYRLYGLYDLAITVKLDTADLLQDILSDLKGIASPGIEDAARIGKALEELRLINGQASDLKAVEENIRHIINATNEIRKLTVDTVKLRLKLDELIKIWEKKWYLME